MSRIRNVTAAIAVLFLATAPLAAQSASQDVAVQGVSAAVAAPITTPGAATERVPAAGPTQANAQVGVRANVEATTPAPAPSPSGVSHNPAMMIVGGATFIVGALVLNANDTAGAIIMVVGAVIGLVGLWNYLQ